MALWALGVTSFRVLWALKSLREFKRCCGLKALINKFQLRQLPALSGDVGDSAFFVEETELEEERFDPVCDGSGTQV